MPTRVPTWRFADVTEMNSYGPSGSGVFNLDFGDVCVLDDGSMYQYQPGGGGSWVLVAAPTSPTFITSALETGLPNSRYLAGSTGEIGLTDNGPGANYTIGLEDVPTVTPASYTNANITVDSKGRITAAANGSSGGGAQNYWNPMASPTIAHPNNLEFSDPANVTALTLVNPGGLAGSSISAREGHAELRVTSPASFVSLHTTMQAPCPSGTFTAEMKLSYQTRNGTNTRFHGFLLTDGTQYIGVDTEELYTVHRVRYWPTWTGASNLATFPTKYGISSDVWHRIRWDAATSTASVDVGTDGIGWYPIWSGTVAAFTPTHVAVLGFSLYNGEISVLVPFLRFRSTAGWYHAVHGRVV